MKVDINKAARFGEWCSEEDSEYEVYAWFEKSSFKFFYTSNLIEKFGYEDCEEIENSGHFIPVFKVDIIALQKEFIANYPDKEIAETMNEIIANDNYEFESGYEVAFRILTQDYPKFYGFRDEYHTYEQNQLVQKAKEWCCENNIPYYEPFDRELKLDLNKTLHLAIYYSDDKHQYPLWWLDKKDYKIITTETIKKLYDCKNQEEISKNQQFVLLFKKDMIELEKEYIANHFGVESETTIETILKENEDFGYEDAFYEFVSDKDKEDDWKNYMDSQLMGMLKSWCTENNIPYYISKSRPDHLGSKGNPGTVL